VALIRRTLSWVLGGVSILGGLAALVGLWSATQAAALPHRSALLALATAFLVMAPWSLKLPSGAAWRPSMALVAASIFLVPGLVAPLVAVPGLVLVTALSRSPWHAYPLTVGHVAAGLYGGAAVYQWLAPPGTIQLPAMLPAGISALAAHFVINRLISTAIVAHRDRRRYSQQLRLIIAELNWGHVNLYLMSAVVAEMYQQQGAWGLLLSMALLAGIYQSVSYYTNMHQWQQAASTDGLTGAENRTAWEGFLHAMQGRQRVPGTLFMFDLDNFKAVNDSLGHMVGDSMLREVALTLKQNLRKSDRLFRYGGDEFVLFITHVPGTETVVRQRVMAVITDIDLHWSSQGISARLSVGCATWPVEAATFCDLLGLADERMYSAKAKHKLRLKSN
jgi:diguanylate cyclase (GGDEF)-like protein